MRSAVVLAGIAGGVMASSAMGQMTVDLVPSADTSIYSTANDLANGAGTGLFAGASRRALMTFDLSSIPAGSTITAAALTLNMDMTRSGPSETTLHRLLDDWGAASSDAACCGAGGGGAGAPAETGDATWSHRFWPTDLWEAPGGDFIRDASATTTVDQNGPYTWAGQPMVDDLQGWLDDPSTNYGWIMQGDGGPKRYGSSEFPTMGNRPMLSVTFVESAACPCEFGGAPDVVNVQDLLEFLALWFVMDAGADFNADTTVDIVDLLEFLACWFDATASGCTP